MNKEAFDELRVAGAITWEDANVIYDAIVERKPVDVVELGCFMGLSTLVMLGALEEVGRDYNFLSVDIKAPMEQFNFATDRRRSELVPILCHQVTLVTHDALEFLKGCKTNSKDLVFEDTTHKTKYTKLLIPEIMRVLRPGGIALFHDLQLPSMQLAFKQLNLNPKLYPPSWMGSLEKETI